MAFPQKPTLPQPSFPWGDGKPSLIFAQYMALLDALIAALAAGNSNVSLVAALPAAGTVGRRAFVTDATATTFASIVAGSGTNKVPVYDDGTNWRIG